MSLLSRRLNRRIGDPEWDQASEVARAVGYLPLAIELAAAQIIDGVTWSELLSDLNAEVARLESLNLVDDRPDDERTEKSLSLLGSYSPEPETIYLRKQRRREFAWLGILPEDVTLTSSLCSTLWDCNERSLPCNELYDICGTRAFSCSTYPGQMEPKLTGFMT